MRLESVARNYAEALVALGVQHGRLDVYYDLLDAVASAVDTTPELQTLLMSPRVPKAAKAKLLSDALGDAPREFKLFVSAVVRRGRQLLFRHIATEYQALLDVQQGRVRASVTLARPADAALRAEVTRRLSQALGKDVVAVFREDPAILGGTVVRVGDRVLDGSLRRRMQKLRRTLLG
ncbi:MAG: ATP synthase F1 subunit delta [Gemmatimonadales bacterium]|nr:ATP synthase F1 subunit delta [Gemmatimonadales bacterium]